VNASLLRALLGAQDQLLAAARIVDDQLILARIREINMDVTRLIARAVKDQGCPVEDEMSPVEVVS
jgi:hypothetical protein